MVKLVCENLNSFVRNQDPVKSLGLGYEGKIHEFFRNLNISNERYKITENNEIVFKTCLNLENKNINELPDNLSIEDFLNLKHNPISELPNNLCVCQGLYTKY